MIESSKINESKTARKRKSATTARSGGRAAPTRSPSPEPLAVETPGPPRHIPFLCSHEAAEGRIPGTRRCGRGAVRHTKRAAYGLAPLPRHRAPPRAEAPPAGRHRAPRCRRVCARGFVCPRSAPAHGALGGLRRVGAAARCSPLPEPCGSAERGGNGGTRAPTAVARPGPAPPERPRAAAAGPQRHLAARRGTAARGPARRPASPPASRRAPARSRRRWWRQHRPAAQVRPRHRGPCRCHALTAKSKGETSKNKRFLSTLLILDRGRTRTCNLLIRSQTPYPLGHAAACRSTFSRALLAPPPAGSAAARGAGGASARPEVAPEPRVAPRSDPGGAVWGRGGAWGQRGAARRGEGEVRSFGGACRAVGSGGACRVPCRGAACFAGVPRACRGVARLAGVLRASTQWCAPAAHPGAPHTYEVSLLAAPVEAPAADPSPHRRSPPAGGPPPYPAAPRCSARSAEAQRRAAPPPGRAPGPPRTARSHAATRPSRRSGASAA